MTTMTIAEIEAAQKAEVLVRTAALRAGFASARELLTSPLMEDAPNLNWDRWSAARDTLLQFLEASRATLDNVERLASPPTPMPTP